MMARGYDVWPLYIRQGLRWEAYELYWLGRYLGAVRGPGLQALTLLSVPMRDVYGTHWSTGGTAVPGPRTKDTAVYLPGRNMVLTVKAAIFAAMHGIPLIALGSLDHNPFADASPDFFKLWAKALSKGLDQPLSVIAPYRGFSKAQVIQRASRWPLHLSFSCLSPRGRLHCGRCNKCAERRRAFRAAQVIDQTRYAKK